MSRLGIKIFGFLSLFTGTLNVFSQDGKTLLQFSGVVLDSDSLNPVPFSNVIIKNTNRGTVTDFFGFYSFVAQPGDSITFSSLGYRSAIYVIPDTLKTSRYSLIQVLQKDTITLQETFVYPWPSIAEFRDAFMNLQIPDDDYERALYNLEQERLREKFEGLPMDATANANYAMQQYQNRLYNAGLYPVNNLLNPLAWARFVEAWKRGDFKKK